MKRPSAGRPRPSVSAKPLRNFAAAIPAYAARVKDVPADAKDLPVDLEWSARARCDQAEMELRLNRAKEAQDLAAIFLKDPLLSRSRYRGLGLYYHGYATFLLGDPIAAGRSLNQLTPFTDPVYGLHARFLLGRVFQTTNQPSEAAAAFRGSADRLRQAETGGRPRRSSGPTNSSPTTAPGSKPWPAARCRSTSRKRSSYSAALQYEAGKFGEALTRFRRVR